LIVDDRLTNAAVALYGRSDWLAAYYPQLAVRLARFRGRDRLADFIDNRQYWGHAFATLSRAESFLLEHIPIAGRVVPGRLVREDRPRYAPRATREALANAICHRDYTIHGGTVAVAIYDDRLEITNPGELHFGITPDKLVRPHESQPWNPTIAQVFYRAGIIERWGTGTTNMVDWCREIEAPPPTWAEHAFSVFVAFLPAAPFESAQSAGPESGPESRPESLTTRVLRLLAEGSLSKAELSAQLGERAVSRQLNQIVRDLLVQELIARTVPDKPTSRLQRYRLTDAGRTRSAGPTKEAST
jgi:ATP-dependent DNA helicase RecG